MQKLLKLFKPAQEKTDAKAVVAMELNAAEVKAVSGAGAISSPRKIKSNKTAEFSFYY